MLGAKMGVTVKTALKTHPQGPPPSCLSHGVTSRAAPLGPNLSVPTSTKHPGVFPMSGWVSILLSSLQPWGKEWVLLGSVQPSVPWHLVLG